MEMTLVRFQQVISAIRSRRYLESREENARFSWLGRSVSTFIAAGYMISGDDNPAVDAASKLAIDDVEAILVGATEEDEWKPGDKAIVKEPKVGSFEKLAGSLGPKR